MEKRGIKRKGDISSDVQNKWQKSEIKENGDFINYLSEPPSLQSIAVVSIATTLCTQPDMIVELGKLSKLYSVESYEEKSSYFTEKVLEKLSKVCLPDSLKTKISGVMRPILLQLIKCFSSREVGYYPIRNLIQAKGSVYWTMEGTIDKVRLLLNADIDVIGIKNLYYLASKYCMEEFISELRVKLSENKKIYLNPLLHRYELHIVAYWIALGRNKLPELLSELMPYDCDNIYDTSININQNMISMAIHTSNSLAFKYFWYKLTEQEKALNVRKWCSAVTGKSLILDKSFVYLQCYELTDIMCFLLSKLDGPEEQKEVFQLFPLVILKSVFFIWPFQKTFLDTVLVMLNDLDEFSYMKIMSIIFSEIKERRTTHELFREIWCHSPPRLQGKLFQVFPNRWYFHRPVLKFLCVDDVETLLVVLSDASSDQKRKAIFELVQDRRALFDLLLMNKLELLDELLQKTLETCDIALFKLQVKSKHSRFLFYCLTCRGDFQTALKFLNWIFSSAKEIGNFKKTALDPVNIYFYLIYWGDYESFNSFMKWYFKSEDKINKFKQEFIISKIYSSYERELLLSKFCRCGADAWDRFEKFLNWSTSNFFTQRQISHVKTLFLKGVASVVTMQNFDFATKLLNWCVDSADAASQFKNELLLSSRFINLLVCEIYSKCPRFEKLENYILWFVPVSAEVISKLKSMLKDTKPFKKNKLQSFYCFLDKFVQKNNAFDCNTLFHKNKQNEMIFDFGVRDFDEEYDVETDFSYNRLYTCISYHINRSEQLQGES